MTFAQERNLKVTIAMVMLWLAGMFGYVLGWFSATLSPPQAVQARQEAKR